MTEFDPPLRLHLNGAALVANWRFLQAQGRVACGAAVKADAYGLGARDVVTRLRGAGCRDFFVAHWAEAAAIADLVPPGWISVLNGIEAAEIPLVRQLGAIPVLNTPSQVAMWKAAGGGRCHVMLDTGINRLGIGPEQISPDLFEGLDIDILMSHLASADEHSAHNAAQLALFADAGRAVKATRRSLANSAGVMLGPDYHFDLTRPGIALYGGIVRDELARGIAPVAHIAARILQVRQLQAGDPVGYNATHICTAPTRIATLSIGYADGYLRAFSGKGVAMTNGVAVPVVGRVSMDLVTVDISAAAGIGEGDWVDIDYDLPTASRLTGLSQYELLTNLGGRFERVWASL
jgi:alanine racemase